MIVFGTVHFILRRAKKAAAAMMIALKLMPDAVKKFSPESSIATAAIMPMQAGRTKLKMS